MRIIVQNQIVLETTKLKTLEKKAHQWMNQALPSLDTLDKIFPRMKILLDKADGKNSTVGDRHDQYHRPSNTREDVDYVKHYNLDH